MTANIDGEPWPACEHPVIFLLKNTPDDDKTFALVYAHLFVKPHLGEIVAGPAARALSVLTV